MRKASGLRNKWRTGQSTYCVQKKGRKADRYGRFEHGRQVTPDSIAGHAVVSIPDSKHRQVFAPAQEHHVKRRYVRNAN